MGNAVLYFHALTPVHSGTGQSVDVIDLPIARERTTGWPYIPGSSIKGVLRDACTTGTEHTRAFGPDTEHASDSAGNLLFADARLVCFPVRSFAGVFAWVTCPSALQRLARDCSAAGVTSPPEFQPPGQWEFESAAVCSDSAVTQQNKVILEEYDLNALGGDVEGLAGHIASQVFPDEGWQHHFKQRFVVVHDDMFSTLTETATEVVARIAIDETKKVVKSGALWYEEAIPAEAIFVSILINAERNGQDDLIAKYIAGQKLSPIQVGGNASVGRGLMRVVMNGKELEGGAQG